MQNSSIRRLTLADLTIFIAASAGALYLIKLVVKTNQNNWNIGAISFDQGLEYYSYISPCLLMLSSALLVVRVIEPRPSWRRICRQPGTIACMAFLGVFVFDLMDLAGRVWLARFLGRPSPLEFFAGHEVKFILISSKHADVVAMAWITLAISGRWRAEPSWIDRTGRVFGVVAILCTLATMFCP